MKRAILVSEPATEALRAGSVAALATPALIDPACDIGMALPGITRLYTTVPKK